MMRSSLITAMLAIATTLSACSSTVAGTPASTSPAAGSGSLPARPQELPVDAVDPCSLINPEQREVLGVGAGRPGVADDGFGSRACIWSRYPEEPQDTYQVRAVAVQGAEVALRSATGASVIPIGPFTAVETQSPHLPTDSHCVLIIDVAAGQHLSLRYEYDGSTVPMTRELACEKAWNAAGMAVQTLRDQSGG
jgi:uncharacterized protein DUF3558